ncbi:MAG: methyltransferase [Candidatus Lokiarchaeota archaeon]|nr:methyltransferase [Candidatus Lokiarchaeota archaeon]
MKISELVLKLDIPRLDEVYYPLDDSYLYIDYLETQDFTRTINELFIKSIPIHILDLGCGTGILGFCTVYKILTLKFATQVDLSYVDINPIAIETVKSFVDKNFHLFEELEDFSENSIDIHYYISDLFSDVPSTRFDLVVFNPPYLPNDEEIHENQIIDQALYGGSEGVSVSIDFFNQISPYLYPHSNIYFIASSLGGLNTMVPKLSPNFKITLLQSLHIFFEDILLFHARPKIF